MNKKAINRDSLQALFDKYDHVVNKNEFRFLGEVAQFKIQKTTGAGKDMKNPNYRELLVKDDKGNVINKIKTARVVVEIPSPFRMDENQQLYPTKIPLFTTDYGVDNFQEVLPKSAHYDYGQENRKWIFGVGKIQTCNVVANIKTDNDIVDYLKSISIRKYGHVDIDKVVAMAKTIHVMGGVGDNLLIPSINVWCDEIADGSEVISKYQEKSLPIQENNALLQGLVYMPPSIKETSAGEMCVHFKLRVKRFVEEGRNVPTMQESKGGYDIINVVGFGDKATTWFEKLEQGHPVKVVGRLESSRYIARLEVNEYAQKEIAGILDIPVEDDMIQDIVKYVYKLKKKVNRPSFNVWATDIVTDEDLLDKE